RPHLRGKGLVFFECVAHCSLETLAGYSCPTYPAEFAILGTISVVAIKAIGGEVLDDMAFDLHSVVIFLNVKEL
ncbi:MAG TPA: hypothetical protein VIV60_26255, partial [Polyangiaceae bacterium]